MMKNVFRHLRAKIFAGILVILPLGITFLILKFVFNTVDSILGPLMPHVKLFLLGHEFAIPGFGIIAFFLTLYLAGLIATNVLGRKLVHWTDRLFINIPVVKNIYLASKQLTDAFSASRKGAFRQAVFVEFPQANQFVLGFVTNELPENNSKEQVAVFLPTAFVPPQGFLLFLPKENVRPSRLTIEEAIKTIMSVGIVTPPQLSVPLSAPTSEMNSPEHPTSAQVANAKPKGGP